MKEGNLESRIEFRVTEEEREEIREQAEASGLSKHAVIPLALAMGI